MTTIKERYSLADLATLPTLESGHFDNLKIVTEDTKVWLSRVGKADGAEYDNGVTVEELIDGVWKTVQQYEAKIDVVEYARDIVDSWDMDRLIEFAIEQLIGNIKCAPGEQVEEEYRDFYGI